MDQIAIQGCKWLWQRQPAMPHFSVPTAATSSAFPMRPCNFLFKITLLWNLSCLRWKGENMVKYMILGQQMLPSFFLSSDDKNFCWTALIFCTQFFPQNIVIRSNRWKHSKSQIYCQGMDTCEMKTTFAPKGSLTFAGLSASKYLW